jgi:hypothetical protein
MHKLFRSLAYCAWTITHIVVARARRLLHHTTSTKRPQIHGLNRGIYVSSRIGRRMLNHGMVLHFPTLGAFRNPRHHRSVSCNKRTYVLLSIECASMPYAALLRNDRYVTRCHVLLVRLGSLFVDMHRPSKHLLSPQKQ